MTVKRVETSDSETSGDRSETSGDKVIVKRVETSDSETSGDKVTVKRVEINVK